MLTTSIDSGKSPESDSDLQVSAQLDPQVIQEYREIYLQIAIKVQHSLLMRVLYTYDALYKLGSDQPQLSYRIEFVVGSELRSCGYSLNDQVNILFHGPYIQSQMLCHCLSESGARHYIRQRLTIGPTPPAPLKLVQAQPTPTSAA